MDQETNDERTLPSPEDEAAALALAVVAQASAIVQADAEAVDASDDNLRDVVAELTDEPLTARQDDVVATLGAAGGSLAAGLASALAHAKGVDPAMILGSTAQAVIAQTQSPFVGREDALDDAHDPELQDASRPDEREDDDEGPQTGR